MSKSVKKGMEQKLLSTMAITAVFNTLIAIVLKYLVLVEHAFIHVFIISQIVGLSLCICMATAKKITRERGPLLTLATSTLAMVAGVLVGSLLSWLFLYIFQGQDFRHFLKDVSLYTLVFGIVFGVPVSYFFSSREKILDTGRRIQEEKIKRLTLEKESAMTTMKLMQAQIEPHFLFNTLSNVITLLDIDANKAKQMLIDLNAYLRISLQRTRQEMVTLEQEFEFITRYLDIFKIRMGQRLHYKIDAEPQHRKLSFPPMILQPLVENSVQHGLEPKTEGGQISVACTTENGVLRIVVADTGMGFGDNQGRTGIGLNNVSTRLEYIYGPEARFILTENHPSGVIATIEVPI